MREMKLSITGISKGEKYVEASADITFIYCVLGMDISTRFCRLDVSVPYQEGKTPEQYEVDLIAAAKERIVEMYKELVCGGEMDSEIVIGIRGKCESGYNVKVISKNGKLYLSSDASRESGETSSMWSVELDEKGHIISGADNNGLLLQELVSRITKLEERCGYTKLMMDIK